MKHLRKFKDIEEYNNFLASGDYIAPNVSVLPLSVKYNYAGSPMYIEAIENITINITSKAKDGYYSKNLITWEAFSSDNISIEASLGERVYFKAAGSRALPPSGPCTFEVTGACNVGGNVLSMRYGDDYLKNIEFDSSHGLQSMFANVTTLVNAKDLVLPTKVNSNCYYRLFYGCTNLKTAPILPAVELTTRSSDGTGCYQQMFYGCTNLRYAPTLPAKALSKKSYYQMFYGCTSLRYIKMLATDITAANSLTEWTSGVFASGTFVKNETASWDIVGVNGIPDGWIIETTTG